MCRQAADRASPATAVRAILLDPTSSSRLYVATGEGLYKSTNGGTSWDRIEIGNNSIRAIALDSIRPSTLYAGTDGGLFTSSDSGGTWSFAFCCGTGPGGSATVAAVATDPQRLCTVHAGGASGLYKSEDCGRTWSQRSLANTVYALALDAAAPTILYAATDAGILQTVDGGKSWNAANRGIAGRAVYALAIDPRRPSTLYAGADSGGVSRSTDGGASWTQVNNGVGSAVVHALAVNPVTSAVYAAGLDIGLDVFIAKLSPSASALLYSTYLGGVGHDIGHGIALDSAGNVYVTGQTTSSDFPASPTAFQAQCARSSSQPAAACSVDAYVVKLDTAGSAPAYSTYLGGSGDDVGYSIAVDSAGNAYVTGVTQSAGFPTAKAIQGARAGARDAFVTKFNAAGSAVLFSTYLGGSGDDTGQDIAVDSAGNAYVIGTTVSPDFPTANPLMPANRAGSRGSAFVTKVTISPAVNPGGVLNGAGYKTPVAAGSIVSLFGVDLASAARSAAGLPLPAALGDVTVRVNGVTAPLFFVSPAQINFLMPWEVLGQSQASVTVTVSGQTSAAQTVALAEHAPGVFSANSRGTGQGAILIAATGELAAPAGSVPGAAARPVNRGEHISIFCTGLGDVSNRPAGGAPAPNAPLSITTATPNAIIGGVAAPMSFSGLSPGFAGLYQVNVQVPDGVRAGDDVPVLLTIGGVSSNAVTIAVR